MPAKTNPVPQGYHHVTPYLIIKGAAAAMDFYKDVFGATEIMRMPQPDGRIGHAEMKMGDSLIMLADEYPDLDIVGRAALGMAPGGVLLAVEGRVAAFNKPLPRGPKGNKPLADQVYGDRSGAVI